MSKQIELLKSYANDFSLVLGVECKVISGGSKDVFAIAKCMGDGAVKTVTAFDSGKSLIKICQAYLDGVRFQQEQTVKSSEEHNTEHLVSKLKFVIYSPNESATNREYGFWSMTYQAGGAWVDFDNASLYCLAETRALELPDSLGKDARWVLWDEANRHYGTSESSKNEPLQPVRLGNDESNRSKVAVGRWDMPKYIGPSLIGAVCQVRFLDEKLPRGERYFSFGQFNEKTEVDEYGVSDNDIFFYAHEGESQIKKFMVIDEEFEEFEEFVVLSYYLKYQDDSSDNQLHYEMEITDNREVSGQLNVDIGAVEGNMDDILTMTFEINMLPGTGIETQCAHLHFDGENVAVSIFKKGDSYIIRPEQGVTIQPILLETGYMGYVLE